jgi:chain length determinant protein EpsF
MIVSVIIPPRYTAMATVVVDFKGIDPISGGFVPVMPMLGAMATQVDIIQSHSVARRAVDLMKLAENPSAIELHMQETGGKGDIRDFLAELLLKHLKVDPARESSVINVSYTGDDPRFSAAVANAIVQSYINTNLELKTLPAQQTNTFFKEQIKALKDTLEKAQANLSAHQRAKGIVATDERLDVESNRLNDLSTQFVSSQAQTFDAQQRQLQVQEAIARGEIPDSIPDVVSNPVIQQLKTTLTGLESKLNDLSSKVGKNHPHYIAVTAEIAGVRSRLKEEMSILAKTIGNNAAISKRREDQVKASLEGQRARVLAMKQVRDDLTVLIREVENAQRAYDAAQGRMTQTKLESQTTQTNVSVINAAVEPIDPSWPKLWLNGILSVILGMIFAIAVALLREMGDRVVRSEMDLVETLGVPVLGILGRERRARLRPAS